MMKKRNDESGAALIEYALLVALISVFAIGSMRDVGQSASDKMCQGAGYVRNDSHELVYSMAHNCCGYQRTGVSNGFTCVGKLPG